MDKTPAWAKTLPLGLRGGTRSRTQQALKAQVMGDTPSLMVMSVSSPMFAKKSVKPSEMEMGGYTGHSNGKVVSDKKVSSKKFEDHMGEYYASAPLVNLVGGAERVEKILQEEAKKNIASAMGGNIDNTKPIIVDKSTQSVSRLPLSEIKNSFESGGQVGSNMDEYGYSLSQSSEGIYNPVTQPEMFNQPVTPATPQTPTTTAPAPLKTLSPYEADIKRSATLLRQTAEGTNPYLKKMREEALAGEAGRSAAGAAQLEMKMTGTGMTGEAANTARAAYDRDSRLRATQLEGSIAKTAAEQSQAATQALVPLAQQERSYEEAKTGLEAKKIADSESAIYDEIKLNSAADWKDNPSLDAALNDYYEATGQTGDKKAFKDEQVARIRQTLDQRYQTSRQLGEDEDIVRKYFDGDISAAADFEYAGRTGVEAVRDAYVDYMSDAGMRLDAQGNMIPDTAHPFYKLMMGTYKPDDSFAVPEGGLSVNQSFSTGDTTYQVTGVNPETGEYTLSFEDGGVATGTVKPNGKLDIKVKTESASRAVDENNFSTNEGLLKQKQLDGTWKTFNAKVAGTDYPINRDADGNTFAEVDGNKLRVYVDDDGTVEYASGQSLIKDNKVFTTGVDGKIAEDKTKTIDASGVVWDAVDGKPDTTSGMAYYRDSATGELKQFSEGAYNAMKAGMLTEQKQAVLNYLAKQPSGISNPEIALEYFYNLPPSVNAEIMEAKTDSVPVTTKNVISNWFGSSTVKRNSKIGGTITQMISAIANDDYNALAGVSGSDWTIETDKQQIRKDVEGVVKKSLRETLSKRTNGYVTDAMVNAIYDQLIKNAPIEPTQPTATPQVKRWSRL